MIFINLQPLDTVPVIDEPSDTNDSYVLNMYVYHHQLVGVIEDTNYKQLFEMEGFTPADYISWRFETYWQTPVLNVYGRPFRHRYYLTYLDKVSHNTGYPTIKLTPAHQYQY